MVCVKDPKSPGGSTWKLKAISGAKIEGMIQAGDAVDPGSNGLDPLCHQEVARRVQEVDVCVRSSNGFALMAPTNDETLMAAPKKNDKEQQDGTVEFLPGMTLWEWAVSETPWPLCGTPGQNEPFQGRSLTNTAGECDKINICHGNAGFGWNRITVARDSLGEPTAADAAGHAEEEHNKMHNKRADYFPMTESVPNPNGAGINGYLDENCGFVCPDCAPTVSPSTSPTEMEATLSPSTSPSGTPSYAPTSTPSAAPSTAAPTAETFLVGSTVDVDGVPCLLQSDCSCEDPAVAAEDETGESGAHGDPHFVMFNGRHFVSINY